MLLLEDLQRPRLSIPPFTRQQSWAKSSVFQTTEHRWNAYLNRLALGALKPWIDEQQAEEHAVSLSALFQSLSRIEVAEAQPWQWVSGAALTVAGQRWIVIPTDDLEVETFRVHQEWVDIPSWSGDYYVMVQLDPEVGWVQLRGYLSHRQLKQAARYDEGDRTYCVDDSALIQDIDLLWVMAELESKAERWDAPTEIPSLSRNQVTPLIQQICQGLKQPPDSVSTPPPLAPRPLSPPIRLSPRLVLPFEQWAGIMENPGFRRSLAQAIQTSQQESHTATLLRQWLSGIFEAAWQASEKSPSFRENGGLRQMPTQAITRGKRLALEGVKPDLMLWTAVTEETDGRMQILVQLRHQAEDREGEGGPLLPKDLELILLKPSEESLQVVKAREQDDYIQLKRFKVHPGRDFCVEIRLGDQVIREKFQA